MTKIIKLCLLFLLLSDKSLGATYDGKWYASIGPAKTNGYRAYSGPSVNAGSCPSLSLPISASDAGYLHINGTFYSANISGTGVCAGSYDVVSWTNITGSNPTATWAGGSGATIYFHNLSAPWYYGYFIISGIIPSSYDQTKLVGNCPDPTAETAFLATCPGALGSYDCATQTGKCTAAPCVKTIDADADGFSQCEDCDDGDNSKTTQCISSDKTDQQQGSKDACPQDQGGQGR